MKLGFVGAGNMAVAMMAGIQKQPGLAQIGAYDIHSAALKRAEDTYGARSFGDMASLCAWADVLLLAVKPQTVASALESIAPACANKALISIVAGLSGSALQMQLPAGCRVLRTMPNTPALVGQGMSALCLETNFTDDEKRFAQALFSTCGRVCWVEERLINAVTGVSGSGPAYAYLIIEAMTEAGVREGLPFELAKTLAAQTLLGSAQMILESNEHPAQLRAYVTSPGGTTAAGVVELEHGGVRAALIDAVHAAKTRAEELS